MTKAPFPLFALLALVSSCSAHRQAGIDDRLANLKRAAHLPWKDDGHCAVKESSEDWATLVERCFDSLDRSRIQFVDRQGICATAQAGVLTADDAARLVGICLLVQPEFVVGAVIIIGAVVVAAAIAAEIEPPNAPRNPRRSGATVTAVRAQLRC